MNYFQLFSLPVQFISDPTLLRQRYFALSRTAHPDYHVNDAAAEQQSALESAALLNKAYKTLGDRDASIEYVLQVKGLLEPAEAYSLPPQFLMDMMEINEALEGALGSDDAGQKAAVKADLAILQADLYEPVQDTIENYRDGETSEEALLKVKEYHFKKKYLQRVTAGLQQK
jgi:molecular chaperone HscB